MGVRIRYQKTSTPNELVSVRNFTGNGSEYKVYINSETYRYQVVDSVSGQVYAEGEGTSLAKLKIKVKSAMASLGVEFNTESRNR